MVLPYPYNMANLNYNARYIIARPQKQIEAKWRWSDFVDDLSLSRPDDVVWKSGHAIKPLFVL
ncbi:MAG: hypothetical protein ACI8V2_004560 [Candidatus Latescibacterota bacterium]|jgi:hypothetical protein